MSAPSHITDIATPSYPKGNSLSLITALVVVDSLHFIVGRALLPYLHPAVSAMYLMGIGCLVVGVFTILRGEFTPGILMQHAWFFLVIGFLIGASTILTFAAMNYIDPGTGSMLAKVSVLVSIGLGVVWLGERLTRGQILGAALAVVGVTVITFQPGEYLWLGSLMILAGTVMYALHTAIVKKYGEGIDLLNFFFLRLLATTVVVMAYVALSPAARATLIPSRNAWMILIAGGIVDVAISRGLYYIALRRFPMSIHAIILTLSPVATVIWSLMIFGVYPLPAQLLGGALVLAGVIIAMVAPARWTRLPSPNR